jgi:hypothetical protein
MRALPEKQGGRSREEGGKEETRERWKREVQENLRSKNLRCRSPSRMLQDD